MENPVLLFYKSIDKSVLTDGLSIPVVYQELLLKETGLVIEPGHRKTVQITIDGAEYSATVDNIGFDRNKYPAHKDLLQIRYSKNSPIAQKLRDVFIYTREQVNRAMLETGSTRLQGLREDQREYLAIYSSGKDGHLMFDCITNEEFVEEAHDLSQLGEIAAESVLDGTDPGAEILVRTKLCKIRRLSRTITNDLKVIYGYRCQICGEYIGEKYSSNLIHAHHIDYFSKSLNNNADNILIVCPNHHGIIHDMNPAFDRSRKCFIYPNGYKEGFKLNLHI